MKSHLHNPYVVYMADLVDRWIVRCDCGCGLSEEFDTRDEAQDAADAAREAGE